MSETPNGKVHNAVQDAVISMHKERLDGFEKKIDKLVEDVAGLKVKSGVWGAVGGALVVAVPLIVWIVKTI